MCWISNLGELATGECKTSLWKCYICFSKYRFVAVYLHVGNITYWYLLLHIKAASFVTLIYKNTSMYPSSLRSELCHLTTVFSMSGYYTFWMSLTSQSWTLHCFTCCKNAVMGTDLFSQNYRNLNYFHSSFINCAVSN